MAEGVGGARSFDSGAQAGGAERSLGFRGFAAGFQSALDRFLARHGDLLTGLSVLQTPEDLLASIAEERPDYLVLAAADLSPAFLPALVAAARSAHIGVLLLDGTPSPALPAGMLADRVSPADTSQEISLTLRALMRRCRPQAMVGRVTYGDLSLDEGCLTFAIRGESVSLSLEVFGVLGAMMDDPEAEWERARLHSLVFGRHSCNDLRAIDTRISRTRRHVAAGLGADPIRTVRGVGYALVADP